MIAGLRSDMFGKKPGPAVEDDGKHPANQPMM